MNAPAENLEIRRHRIESRLEELREARGVALLDGAVFNDMAIKAAEDELAAIADAEEAWARREAVERKSARRGSYLQTLELFNAASTHRLDAIEKAEAAARAFAAALGEAVAACELARGLCESLDPGNAPSDFNSVNFANRTMSYLRGVLRRALGVNSFGGIPIALLPEDLPASGNWRDAQRRHGNMTTYLERLAPAE